MYTYFPMFTYLERNDKMKRKVNFFFWLKSEPHLYLSGTRDWLLHGEVNKFVELGTFLYNSKFLLLFLCSNNLSGE